MISSGTLTYKVSHLCCCWWGCRICFVHLVAEITGGSLSYWRHPTHSQKSSLTCSSDPRGSRSLFQNSARWFSPVSPEEKIFAFLNCLRHERVTCGYWHPMNSMLPKVWARPTWNVNQYFFETWINFLLSSASSGNLSLWCSMNFFFSSQWWLQ